MPRPVWFVVAGFLATVRTEVAALDVSRRALRGFGVAIGGVFLGLVALSAWRTGGPLGPVAQAVAVGGGALVFAGLAAPRALAPVYRVWMTAAIAMGFGMTRVILTVAFALVFTPVGLLFRALRRDPLHQRPDASVPSYWICRDDGPSGKERLERMY